MIESIAELSDNSKTELVASLAVLLAGFGEGEVDAEKLQAIATASGNSLDSGMATLFATVASKCPNGISKDYMPSPGGGGGGGGGAAAAGDSGAAEEAAKEEEPEEEEAPPAMDVFGGGDAGGDY